MRISVDGHEFAFERVGFVSVAIGQAAEGELIIIPTQYHRQRRTLLREQGGQAREIDRQRVFDSDCITGTNYNRLVGGVAADIATATAKAEIARCVIMGVDPDTSVVVYPHRWQNHADVRRACDIIVGCVDTFAARNELEAFSRRCMIP